jgi:hypothetical protein
VAPMPLPTPLSSTDWPAGVWWTTALSAGPPAPGSPVPARVPCAPLQEEVILTRRLMWRQLGFGLHVRLRIAEQTRMVNNSHGCSCGALGRCWATAAVARPGPLNQAEWPPQALPIQGSCIQPCLPGP